MRLRLTLATLITLPILMFVVLGVRGIADLPPDKLTEMFFAGLLPIWVDRGLVMVDAIVRRYNLWRHPPAVIVKAARRLPRHRHRWS
jgi:hypothetical protein